MKRPGRANDGVEQSPVGLHVVKKTEQSVNAEGENAVERKKIGRERDEKIRAVRYDVSAVAAHAEPADPSAHQPNPERVGKFVSENVNKNRPWQTEECNQPQHDSEREKPEFCAGPKPLP